MPRVIMSNIQTKRGRNEDQKRLKSVDEGRREKAQLLRVWSAPAEDLSSGGSQHIQDAH